MAIGKLGEKVSVQTAGLEIGLGVGRHGEDEGTIRGFGGRAGFFLEPRQLEADVAVGGVRVNASAGFEDFDVAIHGVQIFHGLDARDAQGAVHGAEMLDAGAVRNVDGVDDGHFDAFVLRVARGDGDGAGLGVYINGDAIEVGLFLLGGF